MDSAHVCGKVGSGFDSWPGNIKSSSLSYHGYTYEDNRDVRCLRVILIYMLENIKKNICKKANEIRSLQRHVESGGKSQV